MTTESRLGVLEGRTEEHAATIAAIREDLRQGREDLRQGLAEVRAGLDAANARIDAVNARIDRLILAMLGAGVTIALAQVGVIVTLVLRT